MSFSSVDTREEQFDKDTMTVTKLADDSWRWYYSTVYTARVCVLFTWGNHNQQIMKFPWF